MTALEQVFREIAEAGAQAVPAPGGVPLAGPNGTLDPAWLGAGTPAPGTFLGAEGWQPLPVGSGQETVAPEVVDVRDYGSGVGEGTADDTLALQAAAAELAAGRVLRLAARHRISDTICIGDGSATAAASFYGATVRGLGPPGFWASGSWAGSTVLTWDGDVGGTMMRVAGPIAGLRLEGLHLHCAGRAGTGLHVQHAQLSRFESLMVTAQRDAGYRIGAYADTIPNVWNGCADNTWVGFATGAPAPDCPEARGMIIGEADTGSGPFLDVCRNYFTNGWLVAGTAGAALEIFFADNLGFFGVTTYRGVGLRMISPTGPHGASYPGEISFLHCPLTGGVDDRRSPTAGPVFFWPYPIGDGAAVPPASLPALMGVASNGRLFGRWRGMQGLVHSGMTSSQPVTGTTLQAFNQSATVPAGMLNDPGAWVEVRAVGRCTAVGAPAPALTLQIRVGNKVLADQVLTTRTDGSSFGWTAEACGQVRVAGAIGQLLQGGGTFSAAGYATGAINAGIFQTIDFTVDQPVTVHARFSSADPGNTITMDSLRVRVLPAP